jgi:hypothetical protein
MPDVYEKLRAHLDSLPAGFPATESGVELRILKRLFTPEEAGLALHVAMKLEPAAVIAARAGLPEEAIDTRLKQMSRKGLIFSIEAPDRPHVYMAAQFVIGIWEYHVNDLDPDFVRDMDEYLPVLSCAAFSRVPQLRTIPVSKSIVPAWKCCPTSRPRRSSASRRRSWWPSPLSRTPAERAGCEKLMEACLVFGWGAEYYARNGRGGSSPWKRPGDPEDGRRAGTGLCSSRATLRTSSTSAAAAGDCRQC